MEVHLALLARRGQLPDEMLTTVEGLEDLILPFHPAVETRDTWISDSRRSALWSWGNGPPAIPSGIAVADGAAICLSGYALRGPKLITPDELLRETGGPEGDEFIGGLGGVFSILRIEDDRIVAWNTPARLEQVYWAERSGVVVVASRALAAHLVASRSRRPAYDAAFIRSVLITGFPTTNRTPFQGVSLLPGGSRLEVRAGRTTVSRLSQQHVPDVEPLVRLNESLVDSISFITEVDPEPSTALTGGKDSRLVAAVLAEAGVPFTAITGGLSEHPDVVVAKRLAEILGVPHVETSRLRSDDVETPTFLNIHVILDSCGRLLNSDGAHPIFELIARERRRPSRSHVVLGGQGGEVLRGGYAKKLYGSHFEAWGSLSRRLIRHHRLLAPTARAAERSRLVSWLARNTTWSSPPQALWDYYLEFRSGRWAAAGWAAKSVGGPTVWPFFDAAVVRAIEQVDIAQRIDERALVSVIEQAEPRLIEVPLVGARFAFEESGPVGDDEAAWSARAPIEPVSARAAFDWRFHFSSGLGALMLETISPQLERDELASSLDREAVAGVLRALQNDQLDGNKEEGHFAWMLFSAALLLSDIWLEPSPPLGTVRFPLPS
jgi:hypothetical protein